MPDEGKYSAIPPEVLVDNIEDKRDTNAKNTEHANDDRNKKRKALGVFLVIVIILAMIGSFNGDSSNAISPENSVAGNANNLEEISDVSTSQNATESPTPAENWVYSTDVDKVRGDTSRFAETTSTNTIDQDFPYDSNTSMRMTVRHMPSNGTDVVLTISSGQMMCPSYEGCSGTVRFDSGPSQTISFNGPADNSSDTIFIVGATKFITNLKKAKKVVIEKTLYEAGNPQFEFNVSGLKWGK
ncbi:hypothetical protein ACFSGX_04865 [Sphingomonas arantia]|uniref:Uncharacterized protein n=1 Tax=Sphingomonas arantia TaxID=1460676 RepID=A0ABW4TTT6_9SPHN